MATVQNYQCPACGGPLAFDAALGKLKCPYCDSTFSPDDIAAQHNPQGGQGASDGGIESAATVDSGSFDAQETAWNTSGLSSDWGQDAAAMKEYACPSCGAAIICEQTTAATSCPYCNNPTIVETQFQGSLRPDYIIPFKLQKQQAVDSLKSFYSGKPLLPKAFAAQNHLEEVKGVYVPFWFFDGTASGTATFHTTTSRIESRLRETVSITRHFQCQRAGDIDFKLVPVDASKRMNDDLMDSIEPYDYGELKPFSTGFLPGYLADIHDVSVEDCFARANRRCAATCVQALGRTVQGYETKRLTGKRITLRQGVVHYGLLPVYLLNTRFEDKTYTFAVNGQSGKVVGNLPASGLRAAGRFFKTFFTALLAGAGIAALLAMLMDMPFSEMSGAAALVLPVIALIVAGMSLASAQKKMNTVATAEEAGRYTEGNVRLSLSQDNFQYERTQVISSERTMPPPGGGAMGGMAGYGRPGGSFGGGTAGGFNRPGNRPGGGFSSGPRPHR